MPKYIDADSLKVTMVFNPKLGDLTVPEMRDILAEIDSAPAVDVEPKRETGWWIPGDRYEYDGHGETVRHPGGVTCSRCRYSFNARHLWSREYCPHCGAKMLPEPPKEGDDN